MSASTSRKNRSAELAAGPSKKQLALEKAAAKKAKDNRIAAVLAAVIAVVVVVVILFNTGFFYTNTTAVTIGDEKYSPAEVQYYLAGQYNAFVEQNSSYLSIFGLDTSAGVAGLAAQPCAMFGGEMSWAEYFMNAGVSQLTQVKAFLDYAKQNNITLDADDMAYVDANMESLRSAAEYYGVSVKAFIGNYYGPHLNEKTVRALMEQDVLADKAYGIFMESCEYSDAELEEYYVSLNGASDVFTFAYYNVAAETVETTAADGTASSAPTADTLAAAKATAEAIVKAYKAAPVPAAAAADSEALALKAEADAYNVNTDNFSAAVAAVVDGASSSANQTSGANLNAAYSEWMMGSRKAGDVTVVENADGSGYTAVLFISRNDNHYKTAMVRHILVNAEADADGNYSDAALEKAYSTAVQYLNEWAKGEATEESFAAMANLKSDDAGSNQNGGLYDSVTMGSTVPAFNAFCFGVHKPGDTDIVYGSNGAYAGYHIMYYVGTADELYSNQIARSALVESETSEYISNAVAALDPQLKFFSKLLT